MTDPHVRQSGSAPPPQLMLIWCPTCGRDDRYTALRREMQHNTPEGKRCPSLPIRVRYVLDIPQPLLRDSGSEDKP